MATEKRLIYLEDAIARIVDTPSDVATMAFEGYYGFIKNPADILVDKQNEIIDLLLAVSTVDAVEVVRCKSCKYCDYAFDKYWREYFWNKYKSTPSSYEVKADGFCHNGERKEND